MKFNIFRAVFGLLTTAFLSNSVLNAQHAVYVPLGIGNYPQSQSRLGLSKRIVPHNSTSPRPQLAGFRNRNVEILEDGLLRKHPKLLKNSPSMSRKLILRRYANNVHQLRGYMAEALFIDRHPKWNYVLSPNATQHDVTRPGPGKRGKGPIHINGQIKFHVDGNPATYARDMVKDYKAHRFYIPDNHVESTKAYLKNKADISRQAGNFKDSNRLYRNYGRIRPLGATSDEVVSATKEAAKRVQSENYARYTTFGAVIAISMGPTIWDWGSGNLAGNQALYRLARTGSLFGVSVGADVILVNIRNGALRGTLHGNVIAGTVVAIAEVSWLFYEHGWSQAFYQPEFYEQVVGSVSGLTLGIVGFSIGAKLTSVTGFWALPIGIASGLVTGTAGYLGGRAVTHSFLEIAYPEFLQQQERERIATLKKSIDGRIKSLSILPKH